MAAGLPANADAADGPITESFWPELRTLLTNDRVWDRLELTCGICENDVKFMGVHGKANGPLGRDEEYAMILPCGHTIGHKCLYRVAHPEDRDHENPFGSTAECPFCRFQLVPPGCQAKDPQLHPAIPGLAAPKDMASLATFPDTIPEGAPTPRRCKSCVLEFFRNNSSDIRKMARKFGIEKNIKMALSIDLTQMSPGGGREPLLDLKYISGVYTELVNSLMRWTRSRTDKPYHVWFYKSPPDETGRITQESVDWRGRQVYRPYRGEFNYDYTAQPVWPQSAMASRLVRIQPPRIQTASDNVDAWGSYTGQRRRLEQRLADPAETVRLRRYMQERYANGLPERYRF